MKKYKQKDWLYNQYVIEKKSITKIAKENGWKRPTIEKWARKYNIPKRTLSEAQKINYPEYEKYRNKDWLKEKYEKEHKSFSQIAKEVGCSIATIQNMVKKFGIKSRPARPYSGKYNWKYIGGSINKNGYKQTYIENGRRGKYRAEHLLAVEKKLKRKLKKEERVHHKDGNKHNNKIKNLQLFKNESTHQRYEHLISLFAKQLIWGDIDYENKKQIIKLFNTFVKKHSNK